MKHIDPSQMSKAVRLLWEAGEWFDLSPEDLAKRLGVSFASVYNWFSGREPLPAHEALIFEAVEKIKAEIPDPTKDVPNGEWVCRWGKGRLEAALEDPAAKAKDKGLDTEIDRFFRELEAKVPAGLAKEQMLTEDAYLHFQNLVDLAQKFNVPLPKI